MVELSRVDPVNEWKASIEEWKIIRKLLSENMLAGRIWNDVDLIIILDCFCFAVKRCNLTKILVRNDKKRTCAVGEKWIFAVFI